MLLVQSCFLEYYSRFNENSICFCLFCFCFAYIYLFQLPVHLNYLSYLNNSPMRALKPFIKVWVSFLSFYFWSFHCQLLLWYLHNTILRVNRNAPVFSKWNTKRLVRVATAVQVWMCRYCTAKSDLILTCFLAVLTDFIIIIIFFWFNFPSILCCPLALSTVTAVTLPSAQLLGHNPQWGYL